MPSKDRPDLRTQEWKRTRAFILERDSGICYSCGGDADTVDHVIPHSKGGGNEPGNLIAMCRRCNGLKGDSIAPRINWSNPRWGVVIP
jgi:5-methylcytosine-specific restriction endonuclease McrA